MRFLTKTRLDVERKAFATFVRTLTPEATRGRRKSMTSMSKQTQSTFFGSLESCIRTLAEVVCFYMVAELRSFRER